MASLVVGIGAVEVEEGLEIVVVREILVVSYLLGGLALLLVHVWEIHVGGRGKGQEVVLVVAVETSWHLAPLHESPRHLLLAVETSH